jgi:hypothetical protein
MADRLWQELLELEADRNTVVVAVGGGVVGDLAGFVAATYARGVPFFQVPTTLLAQVDSSVGGKVGVNLPGAKNMVGAFWQPLGVLIDTEVLNTLPDREYRAGLAEVVKYGVILDAEFFAYLEDHVDDLNRRRADVLRPVIARCCRLKADVVEQDERETAGRRAVLNYGHTFGHAIEAETGYGDFLHGEAVSIGMLCASRLAERLGRIPRSDAAPIRPAAGVGAAGRSARGGSRGVAERDATRQEGLPRATPLCVADADGARRTGRRRARRRCPGSAAVGPAVREAGVGNSSSVGDNGSSLECRHVMASPFPGMDPYLEDPSIWPSVHHLLITHIGTTLNSLLPPCYVATFQERVFVAGADRRFIRMFLSERARKSALECFFARQRSLLPSATHPG